MAAGLAIAAVVLIVAYLTNYKRHVQNGEQHVAVYVAAKPIPAGTAGADLLGDGYIRSSTVLQRNLVPGFVSTKTKTATFEKLYVTRPLFTNEQLTLEALGKPSARGVQGQLVGTDRAIDVSGTPEQLLAGTLRDGDHVDVIGNWEVPEGTPHHFSRTILRDIYVVRAPAGSLIKESAVAASTPNAHVGAQLKLNDTEARQLFWIMSNGDWSLILRSPVQAANGKDAVDDYATMLLPGLPTPIRKAVIAYQQSVLKNLQGQSGAAR
jgi:Flp pilus assembly protein CpaB